MTKTHAVVAVLGNAPSLAAHLKRLPKKCITIAASRAVNAYPQADILVTIDGNTPPEAFAGLHVTGTPGTPGQYIGVMYERATVGGRQIEFRNTGLLAIRHARTLQPRKVFLAGFDTDRYEDFHARGFALGSSACTAYGVTQAFRALVAELREAGIEVIDLADETEECEPSES